jgi:hypothetical protein
MRKAMNNKNGGEEQLCSGTGVPAGVRRRAAELQGFRLRRNAGRDACATVHHMLEVAA